MAFGTIAAIAGIVSAAAAVASTAYAATADQPKSPSAASSSKQVADAQASALPLQRQLQALEQQGGKFQSTPTTLSLKPGSALGKLYGHTDKVKGDVFKAAHGASWIDLLGSEKKGPSEAKAFLKTLKKSGDKEGAKIIKQAIQDGKKGKTGEITYYRDSTGKIVPGSIGTADFTGYGTADVESQLARQRTDNAIALSDKYGVDFAKEARREAEQADPMGFAARQMEADMIKGSLDNPLPVNPLSGKLESGINAQLKAGSGTDAESRALLDKAVMDAANTRGGGPTSQAVADDIASGWEGRARKEAGITKAQAFLNSGSSPADIAERRQQTDLGNLSAFVNGTTPQAQFGALSSAGKGAVPIYNAQPGATMPNNAASTGAGYANTAYSSQVQNDIASGSQWMRGLSALTGAASSVNKIAGTP